MGRRFFVALCIAALAFGTNTSYARYFDRWGFRMGGGEVVGDNTVPGVKSGYAAGVSLGFLGNIPLYTRYHLWIEIEGAVRDMRWGRKQCPRCGYATEITSRVIETLEVAQGISILHHIPFPLKVGARPFVQLGIEHNFLFLQSSPERYDYNHWNKHSWSWLTGGGIVIPIGKPGLVFAVRYNEDLTDNVDPSYNRAPLGSRFSEMHYIIGMNFDLRKRKEK